MAYAEIPLQSADRPKNMIGVIGDRPLATAVPIGSIYSVYYENQIIGEYISNGTAWISTGPKDLGGVAAKKPAATIVEPRTTYWSVDTDPNGDAIEVSNGVAWVVMV